MATLTPGMFPGDPARAAEAIYQVATADQPRHWVLLGSDALRRVGVKLDALRAGYGRPGTRIQHRHARRR